MKTLCRMRGPFRRGRDLKKFLIEWKLYAGREVHSAEAEFLKGSKLNENHMTDARFIPQKAEFLKSFKLNENQYAGCEVHSAEADLEKLYDNPMPDARFIPQRQKKFFWEGV